MALHWHGDNAMLFVLLLTIWFSNGSTASQVEASYPTQEACDKASDLALANVQQDASADAACVAMSDPTTEIQANLGLVDRVDFAAPRLIRLPVQTITDAVDCAQWEHWLNASGERVWRTAGAEIDTESGGRWVKPGDVTAESSTDLYYTIDFACGPEVGGSVIDGE